MKILTSYLLIIGLLLCASMTLAAERPTIVKMKSPTQGDVLFHHLEHLTTVNECTECHHMGIEAGGCRECHGAKRGVPTIKHAFHRQCRNCHIKTSGPTECNTCHQK